MMSTVCCPTKGRGLAVTLPGVLDSFGAGFGSQLPSSICIAIIEHVIISAKYIIDFVFVMVDFKLHAKTKIHLTMS